MPHRILEESGWFDFSQARPIVEERFESIVHGLNRIDSDRYFDYLMLTAAEAALVAPGERRLTLREVPPVRVDAVAAHIAFFKCDSSPTWPHLVERLGEAKLWDVILFAGDMSKVARVSGENLRDIVDFDGFSAVVDKLRNLYREADNPLANSVASGLLLDLTGLVWHAKAALIDDPEGADDSVSRYLERIPPFAREP